VFHEHEVAAEEVGDVCRIACQQVVDADDGVAALEERLGQVGADEAGRAGDDNSHKDC